MPLSIIFKYSITAWGLLLLCIANIASADLPYCKVYARLSPFDACFGKCGVYNPTYVQNLHDFCEKDVDRNGVQPSEACEECGKCIEDKDNVSGQEVLKGGCKPPEEATKVCVVTQQEWFAEYGGCDTYHPDADESNFAYCGEDVDDNGVVAEDACPECGLCYDAPTASPTESPTESPNIPSTPAPVVTTTTNSDSGGVTTGSVQALPYCKFYARLSPFDACFGKCGVYNPTYVQNLFDFCDIDIDRNGVKPSEACEECGQCVEDKDNVLGQEVLKGGCKPPDEATKSCSEEDWGGGGFGGCEAYNPDDDESNFAFCGEDVDDNGVVAEDACPECGLCFFGTLAPTVSIQPTMAPTKSPTKAPTQTPSKAPTKVPTMAPSKAPTQDPTPAPTDTPTSTPTDTPTMVHSGGPTSDPTPAPTSSPTSTPTSNPTKTPTQSPIESSTTVPTKPPTQTLVTNPTTSPTEAPSSAQTAPPSTLDDSQPSNPPQLPNITPTLSPEFSPAPTFLVLTPSPIASDPTLTSLIPSAPSSSDQPAPSSGLTLDPSTTLSPETPTETPTTVPVDEPTPVGNPSSSPSNTKPTGTLPTEAPSSNPATHHTPTQATTFSVNRNAPRPAPGTSTPTINYSSGLSNAVARSAATPAPSELTGGSGREKDGGMGTGAIIGFSVAGFVFLAGIAVCIMGLIVRNRKT